jgi:protein-S-isoprenylcysteine O-methyltransferase Ste14
MNLSRQRSLNSRAWSALAVLTGVMALLLFVAAGTMRYWQAWVYLAIFVAASALTTLFLVRRDPALLERRMRGGPGAETRPTQRVIMLAASACYIGLFVVSALDRRYGWTNVPAILTVVSDVFVALGFYLIYLVYRENTFTSATVEIAVDQKVISTGPYGIVRHPMYASALLYLGGTPTALGSYWGLAAFVAMLPFLIWRLFDEEKMLAESLPGYREYRRRVRHRLIPGIW